MAKFEYSWEAPEYEYREKDISWYWISIIIAALMIAFAAWQHDFLFGFFIVVAEILFIVWGNREPSAVVFTVTDLEIDIGGYKLHAMKEFESWSTDSIGSEWAEILFYFRSKLRAPLKVIIPEERLEELRPRLRLVLKEVEHEQTIIDSIEKFLHF